MRRVAMLVRNDVQHDARVVREAAALSSRYQVTIFGLNCGHSSAGGRFALRPIDVAERSGQRARGAVLAPYLQFVRRAVAALTAHAPDVVHAHDLDALVPCAIVAARLRLPLVYDAHELYAEQGRHGWLGRRALRALEDLAMRPASAILAASESRAEVMWQEYRVPHRPVAILNCPEGAETIVANGALRRWVAERGRRWERLVIYHGGLFGDRHLAELAAAARLMPADIGMVFVGAGPAAERIRQEGGDRVLLHPPLPLDQLPAFVAGADVGVVSYANTCRNNRLCAPNKLFDYAQVGLPIAAGDLPELARLVTDFAAGVVFRNGDPASMAAAITALLHDEVRRTLAGEGARRLARQFTWEDEARKLLRIYESVLATSIARSVRCGVS